MTVDDLVNKLTELQSLGWGKRLVVVVSGNGDKLHTPITVGGLYLKELPGGWTFLGDPSYKIPGVVIK